MPKYEVEIGEFVIYKIPVTAEDEEEAFSIAYDMVYDSKVFKYREFDSNMGYENKVTKL